MTALLFERIFNYVSTPDIFTVNFVLKVIGSIVGIYFVMNIGKIIAKRTEFAIIQDGVKKLKDRLFLSILMRHPEQQKDTATYTSLLLNDVSVLEKNYFSALFEIGINLLIFLFSLIVMFSKSAKLSLILLVGVSLPILMTKVIEPIIVNKSKKWEQSYGKYTHFIQDCFKGMTTIQNYSIEQETARQHGGLSSTVGRLLTSLNTVKESVSYATFGLTFAITLSVQLYGMFLVSQHELELGEVMAIIQLSNTVAYPLVSVFGMYAQLISTKNIRERIAENLEVEPMPEDVLDEEFNQLSCIHVNYQREEKQILKNINLTIDKGEKVLIVGGNGAGKSTLLKVLQKKITDIEGDIYFNQHNVKSLSPKTLFKNIGFVLQNVFVFNKSVIYNIVFNDKFSKSELDDIIELVGLNSLVNERGDEFIVGESGAYISGGQKQRIEIARALIRKRPILFLDEAFSAIDKQSSLKIENELLKNKELTIAAIQHSINQENLSLYHKVIVLKDGAVVEEGRPDELLQNNDSFLHTVLQS
ncbi:ATP-binding cassette domain-containing protein [Turicibacter sp. TJ11]|uniref:ATP-binding cassette domain-containing protein n=1 Tax=Turicibacter sp. TJ11 TaxID=2806443 RepID=UPI002706D858|nr:ABC transporter ATP-binding protein [Turicibacter sp.]